MRQQKRKKRVEKKVRRKSQDYCVTLKPRELSQKLIICICIRRLQSVRPVNSFVVSFSSAQKMA